MSGYNQVPLKPDRSSIFFLSDIHSTGKLLMKVSDVLHCHIREVLHTPCTVFVPLGAVSTRWVNESSRSKNMQPYLATWFQWCKWSFLEQVMESQQLSSKPLYCSYFKKQECSRKQAPIVWWMGTSSAYQSHEQELHEHHCLPAFLLASSPNMHCGFTKLEPTSIWADTAGRVG